MIMGDNIEHYSTFLCKFAEYFKNMEALILTFAWLIAVMLPFAIWLNTKSGKKWLNNL